LHPETVELLIGEDRLKDVVICRFQNGIREAVFQNPALVDDGDIICNGFNIRYDMGGENDDPFARQICKQVARIRIRVDFPAPLGPISPNIPFLSSRSKFFNPNLLPLYFFERPLIDISIVLRFFR